MKKKRKRTKQAAGTQGTTPHFQRHFRKFHDKRTTGHPQYVYDEAGNKYKVLGITSASETNGVMNVLLSKNPEPGKSGPSYVRPTPGAINKGVQSEKLKGWSFAPEDKKKVQDIIDRHDKKK